MDGCLVVALKQFEELTTDLECYINPPKVTNSKLIHLTKNLFDFMKSIESKSQKEKCNCPLEELIVSGFDNEQIWQEIQLQNEPLVKYINEKMKQIMDKPDRPFSLTSSTRMPVKDKSNHDVYITNNSHENEYEFSSEKEEDSDQVQMMEDDDENMDDDDFVNREITKKKKSVVDDKFFNLADMETFCNMEDKNELKKQNGELSDDDEIDYFADVMSECDGESNDDDTGDWGEAFRAASKAIGRSSFVPKQQKSAREMMYSDFFDPPDPIDHYPPANKTREKSKPKKVSFASLEEEEESDSSDAKMDADNEPDEEEEVDEKESPEKGTGILSTHEKGLQKIQDRIEKLEKANIAEKSWQLKGEVTSSKRPINSLLEEHVTFDHTSVGAPVITEETTMTLEDLIKQRVKDEAWDDVIRKEKKVVEPYEYKKAPLLDQEKSKLSLAEVYEKEYLKQTKEEEEEKENEDHVVIKNMMTKLFAKLDALSNFHFTPKPAKPELTIVTNVPSLQIEEVAPITVSNSDLLAPEEVYDKQTTEVKGLLEKTTTDRKKERREKKSRKRKFEKEKEKKKKMTIKLNPALANKFSKKEALEKLKKSGKRSKVTNGKVAGTDSSLKSSTAFFTRLQEEAKSDIGRKKEQKTKGRKSDKKARVEQMKL